MKTKLFITGLAFAAMTALVGAQDNVGSQRQQNGSCRGIAYADANKNGICDNYENRAGNVPAVQGNGNGKCCVRQQKSGQGQMGCRQGQGRGNNRNFVDTDKNGVCDFREAPSKK